MGEHRRPGATHREPHPLTVGDGSEQSPYLIASIEDWNKFATNVYLGENYNGKFFLMTQNISGCLFDGRLLGQLANNNGGFVGWTANDGSLTIVNSIFAPSEVTMVGGKTFARSNSDVHPTITNCFYTEAFGDAQGKRIYKTLQEPSAGREQPTATSSATGPPTSTPLITPVLKMDCLTAGQPSMPTVTANAERRWKT